MKLKIWGQTDVGLKREINQDSILVDKKLSLFIVADGMGGHKGGEVASAIAVETVREVVETQLTKPGRVSPRDIIYQAYRESSARIHHKSTRENPELMGMGTTMVLGLFYRGTMYIGNVGDSRAYLFSLNNLWSMTEDHSLVNEQIRAGIISEDQIDSMVGRNVITRSVGFEKDVSADILEREVQDGEMLILCSDGLCGLVNDKQISNICREYPIDKVVPQCIEEAKKAGGDDNISVIIIQVIKDDNSNTENKSN